MDKQFTDNISIEDFMKAKEALLKANVPEAHFVVCSPIPYEDQHEIKELRKTQNQLGLAYRLKALDKMREDLIHTAVNPPIVVGCKQSCVGTPYHENDFYSELLNCHVNPHSLGTLSETQTKETTMFHTDECIPYPPKYAAKTATTTSVGPISMALNMPTVQDPAAKSKEHLLQRASQAQNTKYNELRKTYNLIPDDEPDTIKNFIDRIKDGKFTVDLTEKEQAEREFYSVERMLEEITWQDPARQPDGAGFEKANETLRQAYNDVSDEIIVKTPEAGLESLRAFQAKTFN